MASVEMASEDCNLESVLEFPFFLDIFTVGTLSETNSSGLEFSPIPSSMEGDKSSARPNLSASSLIPSIYDAMSDSEAASELFVAVGDDFPKVKASDSILLSNGSKIDLVEFN
eukprot:NODE_135_length_16508_cov_1.365897.p16 type:complete len:113 gc:universal NODE_135_length_16508_cov_1.365897:9580-9918(+)